MSEEIDQRLIHTEKAIHELVPVVQQLAVSVGDLRNDIKEQGRVLHDRIDDQQKLSRPQWTVILSALGALVALIVLHTQPIEELGKRNQEWVLDRSEQLIQDYYQFGQNTAKLDDAMMEVDNLQVELHDLIAADAHNEAEVMALMQLVRDIDTGGSRVWNKKDKE